MWLLGAAGCVSQVLLKVHCTRAQCGVFWCFYLNHVRVEGHVKQAEILDSTNDFTESKNKTKKFNYCQILLLGGVGSHSR